MSYLLLPGRHLCNTAFQDQYLRTILNQPLSSLPFLTPPSAKLTTAPTGLIFAITSSNQQNSRYNPIEFHIRSIGVDRFAATLRNDLHTPYRIVGIPHFGQTTRFAHNTLQEIEEQSEGTLDCSPANIIVVCSTPAVIKQYTQLGYAVLPGELVSHNHHDTAPTFSAPTPIDLIRRAAEAGPAWPTDPLLQQHLHPTTIALWHDFPEVPARITRLYRDPLLNDFGSITETRNYAVYTYAMSNADAIELKYRDIAKAILPGKIVDEGCADAALLVPISRDFPDSDLIGIEITGEFMAQCRERQRRGDFGGTYIHFHQRNLMEDIFAPATIDTTICNSTVHELWSYGQQEHTLQQYLARKFRQTRRGGRIIIRDVTAPENMNQQVWLWLNDADGQNPSPIAPNSPKDLEQHLNQLSTAARFTHFAKDFLHDLRQQGKRSADTAVTFRQATHEGKRYFVLSLKHAAEFLLKKDYTDSWHSEMNEEFTYWPFSTWKTRLEQSGFSLHPASQAYANPWIVNNRFKGKAQLFVQEAGALKPIDFPVTNVVIIGEKH